VGPQPTGGAAIALMRLVVQVQEPEKQKAVVDAWHELPLEDAAILAEEMSRTGLAAQQFGLSPVERRGGPSFLVYYSPAFLRNLTPYHAKDGLRLLAEVYRRARALWPLRPEAEHGDGDAVTVRIDQQLKETRYARYKRYIGAHRPAEGDPLHTLHIRYVRYIRYICAHRPAEGDPLHTLHIRYARYIRYIGAHRPAEGDETLRDPIDLRMRRVVVRT
jgi:hypothetical protein